MFFYNVNAATLTFEQSWFTDNWTENGITWLIKWGDIRGYSAHSGTYHGCFFTNGDYLEANHKLNISSVWVYFNDGNYDNTILRLKGYDEYDELQYTENISHSGYGYENESLNFYNVHKLLVEFDGSMVSFFIDDMSYTDVGALPVELVSFTANQTDNAVILNWITESEINSIGFVIERRRQNETTWQQIASYQTNSDLVCLNHQIGNAEYSYTDNTVLPDESYTYRLSIVNINGDRTVLDEIQITITSVTTNSQILHPNKTELLAACPNPFNPQTKIWYQLAEKTVVDVSVHNVVGQKVRQLVNRMNQRAGDYSLLWDSRNDAGEMMSSGMYFIVLRAGNIVKSRKVVLMR